MEQALFCLRLPIETAQLNRTSQLVSSLKALAKASSAEECSRKPSPPAAAARTA